MTQGTINY